MQEFFSGLSDEEYRKILERARYERSKAMRDLVSSMLRAGAPALKLNSTKTAEPSHDGGRTVPQGRPRAYRSFNQAA